MLIEKLKERIHYVYKSLGSEMDYKIFFGLEFKELWMRFELSGTYVSCVLIYRGSRSLNPQFKINRIIIGSNKLSPDIICDKVVQEIGNRFGIDSTNTVVSQPKIIIETIINGYTKPKRKRLCEKSKSDKNPKPKNNNTLDVLYKIDVEKPQKINLKEPKPISDIVDVELIKEFKKIKAETPDQIRMAKKEREIFSNQNMWKYEL